MDDLQSREDEATTLAELGAAFQRQATTVTLRVPVELAEAAVAAWEREDDGPPGRDERDRLLRHRAGALALIGLAVSEHGRVDGSDVVVDLDAWQVGLALEAADEAGLIGRR
jgi:hypothetical protein